ncbi:MAG: DUF5069 domain-containing protein [Candidatus Eremiobacteraeota bacterium]|nr:DUF5069 domain-containing protein [Candidatus Eremiobacteraeota bacterium]MBC5802941.1 DUF5069 domain-containing protein [Candidatus Eremiobacteraeota bacterium]MBC5822248.1 DUF5069 domain-containing protein [Candidatus Eremiobacteraeota bacterium]
MPSTATKIVPVISSGTAGPLGAVHLPRLWTKLTLSGAGLLPEGYDQCGQGFDQMTLDALGLDRERVIAFIKERKPTYMEFEQYVVDQNGGSIPRATIDKHNAAITGYNHADGLAATMRTASGVKSGSVKDAVTLNSLEDLDELHAEVTA